MREILFKAKSVATGEWVYGNYAFTDTNGEQHFIFQNKAFEHEVDKNTICQYTGLCDKNGNKIWENDVLLQKTTEIHWCQWECMGVVKYGEHDWDVSNYGHTSIGFYVEPVVKSGDINKIACGLNQVDINDEYYPIEVIGNIFDNEDLLQ